MWLPCTADARLGEGTRAAAWRLLGEALCLQQKGESPGPTVGPSQGRADARARRRRSDPGRGGSEAALRVPGSRPLVRPPAPPPPPARSAPPPPGNVVSGSRRRSPIGRLRAPRHNGAAPGRRAGQRRGFPLRRSRRRSASAGGSARPGRAARAPERGLQAPR